MRRVLFIAPQPFFEVRGTPMNIREFVRRLGELQFQTDLLVLPHGEDVELAGVRIVRCPKLPGVSTVAIGISFKKILYDVFLLLHAICLCSRHRYQVIHGVEEGGLIAAIVGRLFKTPYVVDMDSHVPEEIRNTNFFGKQAIAMLYDFLQQRALRKAALAITVSTTLTDYVHKVAPNTAIAQIEDCPLERTVNPSPQELPCARDEKIVTYLYTGNLEPYQGVDLLLSAFAETVAKDQTLLQRSRLIFVGGTAQQVASYKILAQAAGLSSFATFLGQRPPSEMYDLMEIADFLVSPRLVGGNTPLKIYSYMQSGKPIVATTVDAHTSLLTSEHAFLAAPTPASLAKTLLETLERHEQRCEEPRRRGANAQRLLEAHYSREAFRKKIDDAYIALFAKIDAKTIFSATPQKKPIQAETSR